MYRFIFTNVTLQSVHAVQSKFYCPGKFLSPTSYYYRDLIIDDKCV